MGRFFSLRWVGPSSSKETAPCQNPLGEHGSVRRKYLTSKLHEPADEESFPKKTQEKGDGEIGIGEDG